MRRVQMRVNLMQDAAAKIEGLPEVDRDFCRKQVRKSYTVNFLPTHWRLILRAGRESKFLQDEDDGKGTVQRADELRGITLNEKELLWFL